MSTSKSLQSNHEVLQSHFLSILSWFARYTCRLPTSFFKRKDWSKRFEITFFLKKVELETPRCSVISLTDLYEEKQKAIRQKVSCKDYDDFDEFVSNYDLGDDE